MVNRAVQATSQPASRLTYGQTDKHTSSWLANKQSNERTQTGRQAAGRHATDRQAGRDRQTDRQTDRQIQTDRQTDRQTEPDKARQPHRPVMTTAVLTITIKFHLDI